MGKPEQVLPRTKRPVSDSSGSARPDGSFHPAVHRDARRPPGIRVSETIVREVVKRVRGYRSAVVRLPLSRVRYAQTLK